MNASWLTRPLFTFPPRAKRVLTICAALLLVLLIASPGLFMLTWHLLHGSTIETRGKAVYVPLGWIAEIDGANDAQLSKIPFVIPMNGFTFDSIFVGQSTSPRGQSTDELYKTSETLFWNLHSDLGQVISGPIKMGSGSQEAFCMVGNDPKSDVSTASCLLLKGTWSADFMGNKKDLGVFYEVIQKLN
jgi:hypothetical protein